jgi:hypothetical protein
MLGLYKQTSSLVDHGHRTLDEAERTMTEATRELKKLREGVEFAVIFAYVAAVASVATFIILDRHVKRTRAGR